MLLLRKDREPECQLHNAHFHNLFSTTTQVIVLCFLACCSFSLFGHLYTKRTLGNIVRKFRMEWSCKEEKIGRKAREKQKQTEQLFKEAEMCPCVPFVATPPPSTHTTYYRWRTETRNLQVT